eukprot:7521087-Pyramimonas_sp.AAC.1
MSRPKNTLGIHLAAHASARSFRYFMGSWLSLPVSCSDVEGAIGEPLSTGSSGNQARRRR